MQSVHRKTAGTRGFTLLEVLAVVSIVAVLISMTMPALSRAREQARAAVCAAHLKECFNATFMYAQDHADWLPYMGSYYRVTKLAHPKANRSWPEAIAPYLHETWAIYKCPTDADPVKVRIHESKVLPIPSGRSGTPAPVEGADRTARLSYRGEERRQGRLNDPRRPGQALLLIEGLTQPAVVEDHFHALVPPGSSANAVAVGSRQYRSFRRHNGRSHFLFYSGAIELLPGKALERIQRRHLTSGLAPPLPKPSGRAGSNG